MERITIPELTAALVETGAVTLKKEKTLLASGRWSSLYFNIGDLIMSFPDQKDIIVRVLAQTYLASKIQSDRLLGVPEGGNCLASSLVDILRIGQLRVRETTSQHGNQRSIEGSYREKLTVAVFEDITSEGKSIERRAVQPLKDSLLTPNVVITLIDREFGGPARMTNLGIPFFSFTTTTEIIEELKKSYRLNISQIKLLDEELKDIEDFKRTQILLEN